MSQAQRFLCGTPKEFCTGSKTMTDQQLPAKCHSSREEAMKCYGKYLENVGFTKIAKREFINPENGRIRILPRVSSFGGRLRRGKSEKKTGASRYQPNRGAGLVI